MAVCESSQLESGLALNRDGNEETTQERPLPAGLPLAVDYRSPVSHFVPPAVELYAARQKQEQVSSAESSEATTPIKRKRGRPRVDKTSPEYLANLAAKKQAREMAAMMNADRPPEVPGGKRKRGRPRIDKTSPEYLARKRARELEALERKAKREYKRRSTAVKTNTKVKPTIKRPPPRGVKMLPVAKNARKLPLKSGKMSGKIAPRKIGDKKVLRRNSRITRVRKKDSGASSSTGDTTPRVKRKYTKRTPSAKKNDGNPTTEKVKGKRGRPRKDQNQRQPEAGTIRVRNNLMPANNEPISLDSDEEPDLGSPGAASDSLSLDENLRALRHIHEKYANIDKDDMFGAHLLAANFKKPPLDGVHNLDDDVMSVRSSEGGSGRSNRALERDRVEKLEDSSNSDSDSSSSGSGSSSSGSSTSSDSDSDSSDSSDSESESERPTNDVTAVQNSTYPTPPWAATPYPVTTASGSDSEPDPERLADPAPAHTSHDEISESDNESADKSYQCHICRKWYSTRVTLKIHRRGHQTRGGGGRSRARSSDRYECDICSETFPRREKLLIHKAEAHRGAMTFRCSVCRKCFEQDDELAAHRELHTQDEVDGRCSQCSATFTSYDQLRRHAASAHSPPAAPLSPGGAGGAGSHACAHCGKRFTHAHSLTRHLQNHAKQLYRCVVCKASFAQADQLAQHLNSHLDNYKRLKP